MFTFPITMMSSDGSYTISNALMLDGVADSLTKSFSGSGNRNTYTRSFWIKRSKLGAQMKIFDTGPDGGNNLENLYFNSDDTLQWVINDSNAAKYNYQTTQVFRDTTSWYHFVVARNTATVKMYVNGDEITDFVGTPTNTGASNVGRWTHTDQNVIGKYFLNASDFLGGSLAEVIQVDGSILTQDSFGERNSDGVWVAIKPPASLGTNGFHLDFKSANIGNDAAGSNNWTAVSSGPNNVVADTPTDDSSTEVTLYPALDGINTTYQQGTLSNNNKTMTVSSGAWSGYRINMPVTSGGKIYFEFTIAGHSGQGAGLTTISGNIDQPGGGSPYVGKTGNYSMQRESGFWTPSNAVNVPTGHETGSDSSYYKCAYDDSNGKLWFGDADGWYGSSVSDSDVANGDDNTYTVAADDRGGKLFIYCSGYTNGGNTTLRLLDSEWSSSAPSGFSALTKTATGVGNYWTLNPLASTDTLTNGNLSYTGAANFSSYVTAPALPITGKWYWEIKAVGSAPISGSANYDTYVGVLDATAAIPTASHTSNTDLWVWGNMNTTSAGSVNNGTGTYNASSGGTKTLTPAVSFEDNSIMMIAVDMDNSSIWWGNDGTWAGSGNPAGNSNAVYTNLPRQVVPFQSLHSDSATYNFGATAFAHTPPTGFKALNTANLPAPTVTDPGKYFKAIDLGAGNDGTRSVTGVGFAPDLVWIKSRSGSYELNHQLFDVVREDSNPNTLQPNLPDAQTNGELHTTSGFNNDGFTLVHDASNLRTNSSGQTYVAWCMKAGGSPSDNDSGSVTSSVSAADHGGFSIGTFTATSGAFTVGHGLTRAIGMLIVKDRAASGGWWVWSDQLGNTAHYLRLELNSGTYTDGGTNVWNGVHPGASSPSTAVFSTTGTWLSSNSHVFYAFARTPGLIAMGSFTGANATDGSHIFMDDGGSGFKPAWFMFKNLSGNGSWYVVDSARNPANIGTAAGTAKLVIQEVDNESTVHSETSNGILDFVANGVKFRGTNGSDFQGANTFLYLAFAEEPFGGSSVAQARAR